MGQPGRSRFFCSIASAIIGHALRHPKNDLLGPISGNRSTCLPPRTTVGTLCRRVLHRFTRTWPPDGNAYQQSTGDTNVTHLLYGTMLAAILLQSILIAFQMQEYRMEGLQPRCYPRKRVLGLDGVWIGIVGLALRFSTLSRHVLPFGQLRCLQYGSWAWGSSPS